MTAYRAPEPIRETVRRLASAWQESYLLRPDPSWWYFDPTTTRPLPRQGWKLHISAVPVEALPALRVVAGVVMPRGVRWKVARSLDHLIQMCSPPSPVSQVGKFITVYPEDGDVADLAAALHEATRLFDGPVVPSDRRYRHGSNVYLRYGGFSGMAGYSGPDQTSKWFIVDPRGRRVEDRRVPGEYAPSWVGEPPLPPPAPAAPLGRGLFGRDLAVLGVLRQSAKGGVYRCAWRGRDVVVKEARLGTCADILGRDARSLLLNEWRALNTLAGTGLTPEPLDFFYAEDNAYLVEEYLPGKTLRERIDEINYCGPSDPDTLLSMWDKTAELVDRVWSHGVRLRDLTANNIMVAGDRFVIIDLEHAEGYGTAEPPFGGATPGYVRPLGVPADADADMRYALAAIAHVILTGIVPYLDREHAFGPHVDAVLRAFGPAPVGAAAAVLDQVRDALSGGAPALLPGRSAAMPPDPDQVVADAVAAGQELVDSVEWERRPWPWPDRWSGGSAHPASFMAGTAGIVQYYLDLWRATGERDWLGHADDLLEWTFDVFPFVPGQTPVGLYFGVGVLPRLMVDLAADLGGARAGQWLARAGELSSAVVGTGVDSWDVTHGWAGIGIAETGLLHATGDLAHRTALEGVLRRVTDHVTFDDGFPMWPRGETYHYGFGHGSAGVGYFLLHAGRAVGDAGAVELAVTIGHHLLRAGVPVACGRGLTWRHGPNSSGPPWTHWCNGAAGVGLFLLSLWTSTQDTTFLDATVRTGRTITLNRAFGSCCRCHGLAGDGDYLLDLAAALGDGTEFQAGAQRLGRKLEALRIAQGAAPKWPHEGDGSPRPGYMRGYTGIHAFRLRLAGRLSSNPLTLPWSKVRMGSEHR